MKKDPLKFVLKIILAIIIAISVIFALLMTFNTFKSTDESKKDWLTYNNKDYGYSISFPPDWKAYEITANAVDINDNPGHIATPYYYRDFTIRVYSIAPFYDSTWTKSTGVVNGVNAAKYEGLSAEDIPETHFVIEKNKQKYVVIIVRFSEETSRNKELEEILNTFQI